VGDVLASCDARLELTAPIAAEHFGELAIAAKGIAIAFDLRPEHWGIETTFAFGTASLPIRFSPFLDAVALEFKKVAVETAAVHSWFLMGCGADPFHLFSIDYARRDAGIRKIDLREGCMVKRRKGG
jgi:hypothetical protein